MKLGLKLILGCIGACTLAISLIYARFYALPHPHDANANQIGYWLVLKDLENEPVETQMALVDRLIEDTDLISENSGSGYQLSESQSNQLFENICVLKNCWFLDRVQRHHELSSDRKWDFLCKQIDVVHRWVQLLTDHPELMALCDGSRPQGTASEFFFQEVDQWIADAPPDKKQYAIAAVNHSVYVWLSTQSLKGQSMETRVELADRIVYELRRGMEIEELPSNIDSKERTMLNANGKLLMEAWMHKTANELAKLEEKKERAEFVDTLIAEIHQWKILEIVQARDETDSDQPSTKNMMEFTTLIENWIARADPSDGEKLDALYRLARARIFAAIFSGKLFKGG